MKHVRFILAAFGVALALLLALLVAPLVTRAATLNVGPGETYTTIEAAIQAAQPGDTIHVRSGSYFLAGTLFITKNLTIRGGYGTDFSELTRQPRTTIINGNPLSPTIVIGPEGSMTAVGSLGIATFVPPVSPAAFAVTLDGMEVKNGSNGISIMAPAEARVELVNNLVRENGRTGNGFPFGGGIFAYLDNRASLVISKTEIMTNVASIGGGLAVINGAPEVLGSDAPESDRLSPTLVLYDVFIHENLARQTQENGGDGGGAYIELSNFANVRIEQALIQDNLAEGEEGGLYLGLDRQSTLYMRDAAFVRNFAVEDDGAGEIELSDGAVATMALFYVGDNRSTNGMSGLYFNGYENAQVTVDRIVAERNTGAGPAFLAEMAYGAVLTVTDAITLTHNIATNIDSDYQGYDEGSAGAWFSGYNNGRFAIANLYAKENTCNACDGGAAGVALEYTSLFALANITAISNTATYSYTLEEISDGGHGGALYVEMGDDSTLNIPQGRFEHNQAVCATAVASEDCAGEGFGGALYVDVYDTSNASYNISHVTFYSNTAVTAGGAIYHDGYDPFGGVIRIEDNSFLDNYARQDGGAFFAEGEFGYYCNEGPFFNRNLFAGNIAAENGGGAYFGSTFSEYCTAGEFVGNIFRLNQAVAGYGGGADFDYLSESGGSLLFSSNIFTGNVAYEDGGGAYVDGSMTWAANLDFVDNEFSDNQAGSDGGGLGIEESAVEDGGYLHMARNTFARNISAGAGGGLAVGLDEDPLVDTGKIDFVDNIIVDNKSNDSGAGMWVNEGLTYSGNVNFSTNLISRNLITGTEGSGAGLYVGGGIEGGTVIVNQNVITGNVASWDGGGFYLGESINYGAQAEFNGNTLTDNTAGNEGGGCYFGTFDEGAYLSFLDNDVSRNASGSGESKAGLGGGCYVYNIEEGAQVDIGDSLFDDNQAAADGGALYINGFGLDNGDSGGELNIFGNEITSNRAGYTGMLPSGTQTGGNGGGIAIATFVKLGGGYGSHAVNIYDNLIAANHAYTGTMLRALNNATAALRGGFGGAIAMRSPDESYFYVDALDESMVTTRVALRDNVIRDNVADAGFGGVGISMSVGRLTVEGNQIYDNLTPGQGGGLSFFAEPYQYNDGELSETRPNNVEAVIVGNVFTGNQAALGGSLWLFNAISNTTKLYAYTLNNLVAQNSSGILIQNFPYYSRNDTIAQNADFGLIVSRTMTTTASVNVLNSILWDNIGAIGGDFGTAVTVNYSMIDGNYGGTGNLNKDPLFVNPAAGDYRLQTGSLAINSADAGANNSNVPDVDLDGLFRPVAPITVTTPYDRGAYEWRIAEVDIADSAASLVEIPGATASFHMTVTNASNYADSFVVRLASNSLGWPVNFGMVATDAAGQFIVNLAEGQSAVFSVDVAVPHDALGGQQTELRFAVESQRNPYLVDSTDMDVTAKDMAGVVLSPNNSVQSADGVAIGFVHTVTNNGNFNDTINLQASSSKGWGVVVTPMMTTLAQGASTTVHVTVTVPAGMGGSTDVTTLTATSSSALGVTSAQATDTTVVPQRVEVGFSQGTAKNTIPGETVTYVHAITNTGNGPDTFLLAYASTNGWTVNGPVSVVLAAGASQTVNVAVTVPVNWYDGTDVLYIQAVSTANSALRAIVQDTTVVRRPDWMPIAGVALSPGTARQAYPSTTVLYTHYITNTGSSVDAFPLTYTSSNGWAVAGPLNVGLAAGASQQINIVVTVPADGSGKTDLLSIKAVSTVNPLFSMITQDTTVVSQPGVALSPGTALNAMPLQTVVYHHQITNTSSAGDTFVMSYASDNAWSVSGPSDVPLAAGATTQIQVYVTAPAGCFGVNDVLTIRAQSSVNSEVSAFVQNTTVVASLGVELMFDSVGSLGVERTVVYTHTLVNTGTAADTYAINYASSAGWNVNGPRSVALNGGESQIITVAIEAPADWVSGADVTSVKATSELDSTFQASVTNTTFRVVSRILLPHVVVNPPAPPE